MLLLIFHHLLSQTVNQQYSIFKVTSNNDNFAGSYVLYSLTNLFLLRSVKVSCWPQHNIHQFHHCPHLLESSLHSGGGTNPGLQCHHHQHHQWKEWDNVSRGHYPAVLHWPSWSWEMLHCHCGTYQWGRSRSTCTYFCRNAASFSSVICISSNIG